MDMASRIYLEVPPFLRDSRWAVDGLGAFRASPIREIAFGDLKQTIYTMKFYHHEILNSADKSCNFGYNKMRKKHYLLHKLISVAAHFLPFSTLEPTFHIVKVTGASEIICSRQSGS